MMIRSLGMAAVILLVLLGSGCFELPYANTVISDPAANISKIPELNITSPGLESTTDQETININGTSNREWVYVLGNPFPVIDGTFHVTVTLDPGEMIVPVAAGNGMVTTTVNVRIHKNSP